MTTKRKIADDAGPDPRTAVAELSYSDAGRELDAIIEEFEAGAIDVDLLVERLQRATSIVDELDRRLRRTRMQVEELVPRLEAIGREEVGNGTDHIDENEVEFRAEVEVEIAAAGEAADDGPTGLF